ncbi:glycosyl hydrolase family 95 catalytic domain-containing protein [Agromyces sp. SYSU T0242]|uniref:glycosyl hydrolase family 95 catalytic domain-containing protein n=1 Tax=Agromyces litoreus TaxID=3158561 RepID=UPI003396DFFD
MSKLTFSRPAANWLESLPLGNGELGVMVDGGFPLGRFWLNHETGWSGSPSSEGSARPAELRAHQALEHARRALAEGDPVGAESSLRAMQSRYSQAFMPMAELTIAHGPCAADGEYARTLDLATGVHEVQLDDRLERAVVSAPHRVLAIDASADIRVALGSPLRVIQRKQEGDEIVLHVRFPSDVAPPHEPDYPAAAWDAGPGAALEGAVVARTVPADGRRLVLLAAATTFSGLGQPPAGTAADAEARARTWLDAAEKAGVGDVFHAAASAHQNLFRRASVVLESPAGEPSDDLDLRLRRAVSSVDHPLKADPGLASVLFDFGRYLAIASTGVGILPPTLQGIWNPELRPPWSSNYTLNINTQMNHWAAHITNIPETAVPYRDFVLALAAAGRATAKRLYGVAGWVAHHNSDAWLFSSPVGEGHGDPRWSAWPMAGPWLSRGLWDAVEFGAGTDEAARIWPAIRGAAEFALAWHHRDPRGEWVTAPATSPENAYITEDGSVVAVDSTTAMDQQLLHDLFGITAALAEMIGRSDDEVVREARSRLDLLRAEPESNADGTVQEWAGTRLEEDPTHRHLSPLYGLYPGPGTWGAASRAAAEATLERRGDDSTGWSLVWKMALWARLGRADKVSDLMRLFFREAPPDSALEAGGLYPNLLAAHPPFQIDANLAFPAVLGECLLQSHGEIHLLPAVPPELSSGSATGLIARPGVEIDLRWRDGALVEAGLRARRSTTVRLRYRDRRIPVALAEARRVLVGPGDFDRRSSR